MWYLLGCILKNCGYVNESKTALEKANMLAPENESYKKKLSRLITKMTNDPKFVIDCRKIQLEEPLLPVSNTRFLQGRGCDDLACKIF